jgi:hypothetical protein
MRHELYMIVEGCEEVARARESREPLESTVTVSAGGMKSLPKSINIDGT